MPTSSGVEIDLLHNFLAIVSERNLTRAGQKLNMSQQSLSVQLKRLEQIVGRRLLTRTTQGVRPTQDGEALVLYARSILAVSDRIRQHFSATPLVGSVRFGIVEGFAFSTLPAVLGALRRTQPALEVFTETGRTETLMQRFQARELDLVVGGQRSGDGRGEPLWTDKLSWVGDDRLAADRSKPVPLVMPPEPSQLRDLALETLEADGRSWTIFFESDNRTSRRAAAIAGLGLTIFADGFNIDRPMPPLADAGILPDPGSVEFFLAKRSSTLVDLVAELIRSSIQEIPGLGAIDH